MPATGDIRPGYLNGLIREGGRVSRGGGEGNAEASIDLGILIGQQESSGLVNMVRVVAGMGGGEREEEREREEVELERD